MTKNDFYPVIFKRKSIREFVLSPLDDNILKELSDYLDNLKAIYNDIKTELKIISTEDINRQM